MALVVLLGFCASGFCSFWWCKRLSSPALRTSLRSFTSACEVLWDFAASLLPAFINKILDFLLQYPEIKYLQREQPANSANHFYTRVIIKYWFSCDFHIQWPKKYLYSWVILKKYKISKQDTISNKCCSFSKNSVCMRVKINKKYLSLK